MLEKLPRAIGAALAGIRPGLERVACHGPDFGPVPDLIGLSSPAFHDGCPLPVRFTEDGDGVSPPLSWSGVPAEAASIVLLIEDADSPTPAPLVHAIVWSLPAGDGGLAEGELPTEGFADDEPAMGRNSFFGAEYLPPDPPPAHGPHRYVFQLFALDRALDFAAPPGRSALLAAMKGHVLARGILLGTYERA